MVPAPRTVTVMDSELVMKILTSVKAIQEMELSISRTSTFKSVTMHHAKTSKTVMVLEAATRVTAEA